MNSYRSGILYKVPQVLDLRSKTARVLFEQGKLRCPHDKQLHDVLSYKRFDISREFASQLSVVLKCAHCGHIFAPNLEDKEMQLIEEALINE